jgi:hypothetical protein
MHECLPCASRVVLLQYDMSIRYPEKDSILYIHTLKVNVYSVTGKEKVDIESIKIV